MGSGQRRKYWAFVLLVALFGAGLLLWNQSITAAQDKAALGVTPGEFNALADGPKPAAFFFSTTGCVDCNLMRPLWQQTSAAYASSTAFTEVRWSLVTSRLFDRYNVTSTPTFILFVNGSTISRHDGVFPSQAAMAGFVDLAVAAAAPNSQEGATALSSALVNDYPSIAISLVLGIGTFASPCVLPLLPGYLSLLLKKGGGARKVAGVSSLWAFLAGAAGILAVGAVFVVLGDMLWGYILGGKLLIAFALLILGLSSLLGIGTPASVPRVLNSLSASRLRSGGVPTYAFLYGILSLSCSLPFVVGGILNILAGTSFYSMVARLGLFAIGFATPLAVLTFATGRGIGIASSRLGRDSNFIQRVGSFAMIIASFLVLTTL